MGLDLGDRGSRYAMVDEDGELIAEGECRNMPAGLATVFGEMPASRVALETGSQSSWIAHELGKLGHEALVANARELRGIWGATRKHDRRDAVKLARYARMIRRCCIQPEYAAPKRSWSCPGCACAWRWCAPEEPMKSQSRH